MNLLSRLHCYRAQRRLRRDRTDTRELEYLRPVFQKLPAPARVAVDVGANIGRITLALTDLGFRVHALEPHPATRQTLESNLADLIAGGKVTVSAVAASDQDGQGEMFVGAADTLSTLEQDWTTRAFPEYFQDKHTIPILLRQMAALRREQDLTEIGFMKIDTEGHEVKVLQGLFADSALKAPAIVMFEANQRFPKQAVECLQLLAAHGYTCFDAFIKEGPKLLAHVRFTDPRLPEAWVRFEQAYFYANIIAYQQTLLETLELPGLLAGGLWQ